MRLNLRKLVCHSIVAAGVAAALIAPAAAQGISAASRSTPSSRTALEIFQAEIKEYNAVLAKGGSASYYSMWLSQTGPRTFARAQYYKTWAEMDAGADPKMKDEAADIARMLRASSFIFGSARHPSPPRLVVLGSREGSRPVLRQPHRVIGGRSAFCQHALYP